MLHNLIMPCLHHANLSPFMPSLDPTREEPELEVQTEQAEEANTDLKQGKTRCITPQSLNFI
jgi:hypothetical protein